MRRTGKRAQQPALRERRSTTSCAERAFFKDGNRLQQVERTVQLLIQLKLARREQLRGLLGRQGSILVMTASARSIAATIQMTVRRDPVERCHSRSVHQ